MIVDLKPYPETKDSGIPWLEDVPEAWKVLRCRHLFEIKKEIAGRLGHPVLSVTQAGLRNKDVDSGEGQVSLDYSKYQIVEPGDFVMNSMDLLTGGVGIADSVGVTSPDYRVFTIRDSDQCHDRYMLHLFRMLYGNRGFYAWGQGSAQLGRWRLPRKRFNEFPFPVPPLSEQTAIVRFLDHADRRIRRYIRAKQKLIELLEEQKQAIIHRAVTRGLNPDVRLKPSGVERLGDVPEHWDVSALRRRWSVTDCKHLTVPFIDDDDGFPLASVREVQAFELSLANAKRTTREHYENLIEGGRKPEKGDLIYCRNVSVGAASIVTTDQPLAMGQDVCLIRSADENQRYLNYFLRSPSMQHQLALLLVGSTFNRINVQDIKALVIVVPPRRGQDLIVEFLDDSLREATSAQEVAGTEIALLREYRTRLIADVVTGKLDVGEAAARLPEAADEPALLEEADALANDHEDLADELDAISSETEA